MWRLEKDPHLTALGKAVDSIESTFCVEGTHKGPITLTLDSSNVINFPMSCSDAPQQLQVLQQRARPSGFGRGNQTVHDPSVRVAKELRADEFSTDFDPAAAGILKEVCRVLVPDASGVRADLYKLNIMERGGFFKPHKDTPRHSSTCFGTLVVALPVPFAGGALQLRHWSQQATINWSQHLWGWRNSRRQNRWSNAVRLSPDKGFVPEAGLHWVAFFGDVEHEVEKVDHGHRITLTYTLHRETAGPCGGGDALVRRASVLQRALAAALADKTFMVKGGAVGVECRHLYEESNLAATEAQLTQGGTKAYAANLQLKNTDAVVAAVLAAAGLEVLCVRRLKMDEDYDGGIDYCLEQLPDEWDDGADFGRREYIEGCFWDLAVTQQDVAEISCGDVADVVGCQVEWLGHHIGAQKKWVRRWYGENFGNEASTMFYTAASIVGVVPAVGDKQRSQAARKASKALTPQMVRPDIDLGSNSKAAAAAGGCNGGKGGSARGRQSNLGASSSAAHMETAAAEPWSGWFTDDDVLDTDQDTSCEDDSWTSLAAEHRRRRLLQQQQQQQQEEEEQEEEEQQEEDQDEERQEFSFSEVEEDEDDEKDEDWCP